MTRATSTRRASEGATSATPATLAETQLADPSRLPLRVVKVGGSLLDWPPLAERLSQWIAAQQPACSVLIAGGGNFTEAVRQTQSIHRFDDETAHWMCVRALSATALLLSRLLPDATLAFSLDEVLTLAWSGASQIVMDPADFLQIDEPHAPGRPLPYDWSATTDSIAARVAALIAAPELVLLKSAAAPNGSLADLAAAGYVDAHFPAAAGEQRAIRLVNLRSDPAFERTLAS